MNVRAILPAEHETARQLLARCGWTKKVEDPALFSQAVLHSQVALVAEIDGKIVGFIRAITDHTFNGYISMVAVDAEFRRKGVGTALVSAAIASDAKVTWVLRADRPGVSEFYKALGFEPSAVALERRRSAA